MARPHPLLFVGPILLVTGCPPAGDESPEAPEAGAPATSGAPDPASSQGEEQGDPEAAANKVRDEVDMCPRYLQQSWATLHGDCLNSDYARFEPSPTLSDTTVLTEGHATVAGACIDEHRGRIYATRGASAAGSVGGIPNFLAYDRDALKESGEPRVVWDANDLHGDDGITVGPCAATSSPVVDAGGDIYFGDCAHMWAARPDGTLKWRTPLPEPATGSYVTAFLARTGEVGGVTHGGRVDVFDAGSGALLDTTNLPVPEAGELSPGEKAIEKLFQTCGWKNAGGDGQILEETVVRSMLKVFFGVGVAVGNTPAAVPDPEDSAVTRIYVPGNVDRGGEPDVVDTELHRIDYDATTHRLEVVSAFDGLVIDGEGSASSPNTSPDGRLVTIATNDGHLHAFDADTGAEVWSLEDVHLLGSATTDLDAWRIWIGNVDGELRGYQLDAEDPTQKPQLVEPTVNVAAPILDRLEDTFPDTPFPKQAVLSGVVVKSPEHFVLPFTVGYRVPGLPEGVLWPMRSVVAIFDENRQLVGEPHALHDVAESGAAPDSAGHVVVAHASISSSLAHCLHRRKDHFGPVLDVDLHALPEPIPPGAGITVLRP